MSFSLDDSVLSLVPFSPVCSLCKHWAGGLYSPRRCKAFGDADIPAEIWDGRGMDHSQRDRKSTRLNSSHRT